MPIGDPAAVSLAGLRVGVYEDDGFFTPCASSKRAVHQAAQALERAGAILVPFAPPRSDEHYLVLACAVTADGLATLDAWIGEDRVIAPVALNRRLARTPPRVRRALSKALGYPMHYGHPSEIMDEIAALTPTFTGVSYERLERLGSIQWPCNAKAPEGTPVMHVDAFVRGKGRFVVTEYIPTPERTSRKFPLILTTGRILSQYNVGAQTRRTRNGVWHDEDRLELHPHDAENRGIRDGDWVSVRSRAGETALRAKVTERMQPGIVYTTFHHPDSGANVVTTDNSDWATNCPEYKVTAVEVSPTSTPSDWQEQFQRFSDAQSALMPQV